MCVTAERSYSVKQCKQFNYEVSTFNKRANVYIPTVAASESSVRCWSADVTQRVRSSHCNNCNNLSHDKAKKGARADREGALTGRHQGAVQSGGCAKCDPYFKRPEEVTHVQC